MKTLATDRRLRAASLAGGHTPKSAAHGAAHDGHSRSQRGGDVRRRSSRPVRDGRGQVIVNRGDGSQVIYGSEADYQADAYALR